MHMFRPTKAIIAVAGFGTRWLPYTKAIEKCMVPIMSRPWIDYIVEDCINVGITHIYFVVNKRHAQLKQYYSENLEIEEYLKSRGKSEELLSLNTAPKEVTFEYIVQDTKDGFYGTAVPVWLCRDKIEKGESFVSLNGDDFIYREDGKSELGLAIESFAESKNDGLAVGVQVEKEDVSKYGIFRMDGDVLMEIVEKPNIEDAPSTVANASRYILGGSFFDTLEKTITAKPDQSNNEYFITDAVSLYASEHSIMVHEATGKFLDGGNPTSWLESLNYLANI